MSIVEPTLITLRESLEAFLIVSIFAGLVVKLGHRESRKWLLWGAAAAAGVSILVGILVDRTVREAFKGREEIYEGLAALTAGAILTYMIIWMYRHTLDMVGSFRKQAAQALDAGRPGILFTIAFVAVIREGLETVLFFAAEAASSTALDLVLAALIGLAVSATLAFLVFSGIVRLNIQKFFAVTGIILIFFAAGLFMTSVHELAEFGWLPETQTAWDTSGFLPQDGMVGALLKAVLGYREAPTVLEAATYVLYLLGMAGWYLRGVLRRAGRAAAAPEPARSPPRA